MTEPSPFNPIPPVVLALALVMVAVEATLSLAAAGMIGGRAGIGWRIAAIEDYGFSPAVWTMVVDRGDRSLDMLRRFVTYAFVHGSFTQALFGVALTLALGKFVGEVMRPGAVLAVFFAGVIGGAVAFALVAGPTQPLFGSFPGVYALIGAFTYLMWLRLGAMGDNQLKAFRLIGFLLAIQLVFGLLFGAGPGWVADVAGFVCGFAASILVAPGGWAGFVRRMRARG